MYAKKKKSEIPAKCVYQYINIELILLSTNYYPDAFRRKSRDIVIPFLPPPPHVRPSICNLTPLIALRPFKLESRNFHTRQPYGWGLEEHFRNFDLTSWGKASGVRPRRVQNAFYTNIVMFHIKSKVMKSRIQWCKEFAPGACLEVTIGKKVGFGVLFFYCHTTPRLFKLEQWNCHR